MSKGPSGISMARPSHNAKPVIVGRVGYPSICAAARAFGIDPNLVISRLYRGWPLHRALTATRQAMGSNLAVTVHGQEYRSVQAACTALRVSYSRVITRLRSGWDIERAVETPSGIGGLTKALKKPVVIASKRYESIAAAARAYGLDPSIVRERIYGGWSLKDALSTPVQQGTGGKSVTISGRRYPSICAAAHAHGVSKATVLSRIASRWKLKDAVSTPAVSTQPIPITFRGQRFESVEEAANALGVNSSSLKALRRRGMSDDSALEELIAREKGRSKLLAQRERFKARVREQGYVGQAGIELRGVRYATLAALADSFAVSPATLRNRLRLGWTLEQAVGLAERPKGVRNIKEVTINGRVFPNMSVAARHFGVSWDVARYRLQVGATPAQAFGLEPFEPRPRRVQGRQIVVAGERFVSLSEACRRFDKSLGVITERLGRGETPKQAFDLEPPPLEHAAAVIDGRPFRFLAEAARHYAVPYAKLRHFIAKGIEPMEAVRRARAVAAHRKD